MLVSSSSGAHGSTEFVFVGGGHWAVRNLHSLGEPAKQLKWMNSYAGDHRPVSRTDVQPCRWERSDETASRRASEARKTTEGCHRGEGAKAPSAIRLFGA
jgi:hypothetical protein